MPADKQLSLNQQLALLPAAIPDSILDFLEDFHHSTALQTESSRSAFDSDYLKTAGDQLKLDLEKMRNDLGRLTQISVEQAGREIPGGFLLKLQFARGARGVGLLTRLKERTILRLFVQEEFNESTLRDLLKNPPKLG